MRGLPRPEFLKGLELHRSGVVEASAGTGKTYAVEHMVLELILSGEPMERILLITFTEKAATELRVRIRNLFADLPNRMAPVGPSDWRFGPEQEHRREQALLRLGHAQISTIHAFCQRMLRDFAFEGRRPFELELVDDFQILARAVRSVLRRSAPGRPWTPWVLASLQEAAVAELSRDWVEWAAARVPIEPSFDPEAWERTVHAWRDADGGLRSLAAIIPRLGLPRGTAQSIRTTVLRLQQAGRQMGDPPDPAEALKTCERIFTADRRATWLRVRDQVEQRSPSITRLLDALAEAPPFRAAAAGIVLPVIWEEETRLKAESGLHTFTDMTEELSAHLDGPLTEAIRERFSICIVDEFQDTDRIQWSILERIFFRSQEHRLVVVGDPKQSIYGFRGADLKTYREATAEIESSGGFFLRLDRTFRSTPELNDGIHALLSAGGHSFFSGQLPYIPVQSARTEAGGIQADFGPLPALTVWGFDATEDGVAAVRRRWARAIAADAVSLFTHGATVDGRPLRPSDLFVLTRSVAESRQAAAALRRWGFQVQRFDREGIVQSLEAQHLHELLAALEHPEDGARQRRALRTPWFGLASERLPAAKDLPSGHPWLVELGHLHHLRRSEPPHRGLGRLLTPRLRRLCMEHPERYGELQVYRQVLDELARIAASGGWSAGLRWLQESRSGSRAPPDPDAVRVSTIHGAKGLEAECVYVFGGLRPGRQAAPRVRRADGFRLVLGPLPPEAEQSYWEEEERLAYVALTRARSRLVLARFETAEDAPVDGPYQILQSALQELDQPTTAPPVPSGSLPGGPSDPRTVDSAPASSFSVRPSVHITSYSELKRGNSGSDELHEAPAASFAAADPISSETELPGGPQVGKAIHALLEVVDPSVVESSADADVFFERIRVDCLPILFRYGLSAGMAAPLATLVHRTLTRTWDLFGTSVVLSRPHRRMRELDFLFASSGPLWVRGFVDLVLELDGRLVLVDYKSDRIHDAHPAALQEHVDTHYGLQADLYGMALARHVEDLKLPLEVVGTAFLFVRSSGQGSEGRVLCPFDPAAHQRARAALAEAEADG